MQESIRAQFAVPDENIVELRSTDSRGRRSPQKTLRKLIPKSGASVH
jgi:hypothetical protein